MRMDKFLKVSRIIKRRETAKDLCDDGDIFINGKKAKAMTEVHENDHIVLLLGRHEIEVVVHEIRPYAKKEEANQMYEIIRDEVHERRAANEQIQS